MNSTRMRKNSNTLGYSFRVRRHVRVGRGARYVAKNAAEPVECRALLYCAVLLALVLGAAACPRHPIGVLTTAGQRSMYTSRTDSVPRAFRLGSFHRK